MYVGSILELVVCNTITHNLVKNTQSIFLGLSQNKMFSKSFLFGNICDMLNIFHEYGSLGGKNPAYQIKTDQKN